MFRKIILLSLYLLLFTSFVTVANSKTVIPRQTMNKVLHDKLPESIKNAGFMVNVNSGAFLPYEILAENRSYSGVVNDLSQALGEIMGIEIRRETVSTLPALLMGLKAGRFQFSMGPIGDFPSRQANVDFIDYVREYVIFAVPKGNPHNIHSLSDICGLRISVMSGGSAEKVLRNQSKLCLNQGKEDINILSYSDQPTSLLVVRAKRADAFFSSQAPLTYYVKQSRGELELAGVGLSNGFEELYQGAVVAKDSPLGEILLTAMQELFDNGTYELIMNKWGLESNKLEAPKFNASTVKLP